jgi:putative redox protein
MATVESHYLGGLRNESKHLQSGSLLLTDAPTDNQGKGEAFSPTDLLATALGTCIVTTMAITAQKQGIDLTGTQYSITKIMASTPRRVKEVQVRLDFPPLGLTQEQQAALEKIAHHCPVALSLSPEVTQTLEFNWQ